MTATARPRWRRWAWRGFQVVGALLVVVIAVALFQGCAAFGKRARGERLARMSRSPQWSDGGFVNPQPLRNHYWEMIRGGFAASPHGRPAKPPPAERPLRARYDTTPGSGLRVTWMGHSSLLIEIDGYRVLTDPIWSHRASPLGWVGPDRWYGPLIALDELPSIDAVVISHDHYDHLDHGTIAAMKGPAWERTTFVVPLGIGAHLAYWGVPEARIVELDWWQQTRVRDLTIVCTPARHASGRLLVDNDSKLWAGYALIGARRRAYFSGDTGLFPAMKEIGARFGPFDTGILDCLDARTGRVIWTHDILKEYQLGNLTWGVSASPLVFEEKVVVTGAASPGPTVLAFHCDDGRPLWRAGGDKASYASPILTTLAGRRVILSFNAATITAHDPADGAVVLEHRWAQDKYPKAAQPTVLDGDRVFVTAGYGMGCAMLKIEAAPDGKLVARELWKGPRIKAQFNSIAVRDGFLYGLDDGLLACVDAATGERRWKDGRYGSGQTLMVDDLLIVQAERGAVALVEATPERFRELGRIAALSSKTWNHPVLAGRFLFVRNDREAACYELPVEVER